MIDLLRRLEQRKLVQWALAYAAAAFALLQGIDIVAAKFGWMDSIEPHPDSRGVGEWRRRASGFDLALTSCTFRA